MFILNQIRSLYIRTNSRVHALPLNGARDRCCIEEGRGSGDGRKHRQKYHTMHEARDGAGDMSVPVPMAFYPLLNAQLLPLLQDWPTWGVS